MKKIIFGCSILLLVIVCGIIQPIYAAKGSYSEADIKDMVDWIAWRGYQNRTEVSFDTDKKRETWRSLSNNYSITFYTENGGSQVKLSKSSETTGTATYTKRYSRPPITWTGPIIVEGNTIKYPKNSGINPDDLYFLSDMETKKDASAGANDALKPIKRKL